MVSHDGRYGSPPCHVVLWDSDFNIKDTFKIYYTHIDDVIEQLKKIKKEILKKREEDGR